MRNSNFPAGVKAAITGSIILESGRTISLTDNDFVYGSLVYKDGTSETDEISVGAAVISELKFELMNDTGRFSGVSWKGAQVRLSLTAEGEKVNLETFYVVSHSSTGTVVVVECYDGLKILDEYQLYEDNLTFPCDAGAAVRQIAANRGMSVSGTLPSITINDPGNDRMTERTFISHVAQIMGKHVRCDNNVLYFEWYSTARAYDAGTTFSHDLQAEAITVTGVKVSTYDDETVVTKGSSSYQLEIDNNPLITEDNIDAAASNIYDAVNGLSFRPGTAAIMCNPAIEAGDMIRVNTGDETGIYMLVTNFTYKSSTLQETIYADADPYEGDLRINKKDYVKTTAEQTIDDALNDPNSALSKAIAAAACKCDFKDAETTYW